MPAPQSDLPAVSRIVRTVVRGIWAVVEFIGALIYYLLTEIFVDPFVIIKPIKIAAVWLYNSCDRLPVISLYFTYLVAPQNKHRAFHWLSQRPWVVAVPPALVVAATVGIKYLALSYAMSRPALAAVIFVGDKIAFVPIALRMWDAVRPVVRKSFALRQIDNVVHFLFHVLPRLAKIVVKRRMRQIKRAMAPVMVRLAPIVARIRVLVEPVARVLRPLRQRLGLTMRAVRRAARKLRDWALRWLGFGSTPPSA